MHCNRLFIYARSSKIVVEGANSGGKKCVKCVLMPNPPISICFNLVFQDLRPPLGVYVLNGSPLRQLDLDRFKSSDIKYK